MAGTSQQPVNSDALRTAGATAFAAVVGSFGIVLYAYATAADSRAFAALLGAGILMSGASALVGALLGFLFGVPRTMQQARLDNGDSGGSGTRDEATNAGARPRYLVNTNLEQISDWLTKIFVGLGLTQLNTIPTRMWAYAGELAPALGGGKSGQVVVLVLVVCFATDGFFFGYLLTRLFLTEAFMRAERGLEEIAEKVATAVAKETTSQLDSRFVANEMRSALYAASPDGFRRAIRQGERQRDQSGDATPAEIWALLACAYGQAYAWELAQRTPPGELAPLREKALDAVRRAAVDPQWKETLREVWHPPSDTAVDTDLVVFRDDPDFAKELAL